jgi:hypothetical protein
VGVWFACNRLHLTHFSDVRTTNTIINVRILMWDMYELKCSEVSLHGPKIKMAL